MSRAVPAQDVTPMTTILDPYDPVDCRLALDRSTSVPLWAQIADSLAAVITEQRLGPGQSLGSETELARRFHVTRTTIRQALHHLNDEGLITRRRRDGTRITTERDRLAMGPGPRSLVFG